MKRHWAVAALSAALCACGDARHAELLATRGTIDPAAAVKTVAQLVIPAPPDKVWATLTDIDRWPAWQPAIANASLAGPVAVGMPFTWSSSGTTIHATLRLVDPGRALCWSGRAWHIVAIHCWAMRALPGGQTAIEVTESMDGAFVARLVSSADLLLIDQEWLSRLRQASLQ
jgi:uncharacterized protein YndB with AHSA1/START domain